MRNVEMNYCKILMVLSMVTLGLSACGNDEEDPQAELGAVATIQLGEQSPFAMEASNTVAVAGQSNKISLNFTDTQNGLMLMISLISTEDKIAAGQSYSLIPGNIQGAGMGTAKLSPVGSSAVIEENYTTVKDIDGDSKFDGSGTVKITELSESHIAGEFTITMFDNAGEKALVKDGLFKMAIDFKF